MPKPSNNYFMHGHEGINPDEKICCWPSDEETSQHIHDFIEIVFFKSGVGEHIIENEKYIVKSGDIYLINTNVEHCYSILPTQKSPISVINLIFYPSFLSEGLSSNNFIADAYKLLLGKKLEKKLNYIRLANDLNRDCLQLIALIEKELKYKQPLYLSNVQQLLRVLLIKIFRTISDSPKAINPMTTVKIMIAENAIKYINSHYNEDLTLETLAHVMNYSPTYLNTLIQEYSGMSFKKNQQTIRCQKACELLKNSSMSVEDVCFEVGYKSSKQFFLIFKRIIGTAPNQYRKKFKN